jgi:hypothetical protein
MSSPQEHKGLGIPAEEVDAGPKGGPGGSEEDVTVTEVEVVEEG